jgi:hypothetical protein
MRKMHSKPGYIAFAIPVGGTAAANA